MGLYFVDLFMQDILKQAFVDLFMQDILKQAFVDLFMQDILKHNLMRPLYATKAQPLLTLCNES